MKTTTAGRQAETVVAEHLKNRGYKILAQNWKTTVCEIDLVTRRGEIVYFTEVKYRSGTAQGEGFDYIGPQKLKKMHFAARIWVQSNNFDGDYRLLAASVSTDGLNYRLDEIVEL